MKKQIKQHIAVLIVLAALYHFNDKYDTSIYKSLNSMTLIMLGLCTVANCAITTLFKLTEKQTKSK